MKNDKSYQYQRKGRRSPVNKLNEKGSYPRRTDQLINKISQSFHNRQRKDLKAWRQALQFAEHPTHPNVCLLMDLYRELELDLHYLGQSEIRINGTMARKYYIKNRQTGEKDEEVSQLFQKTWFRKFMQKVLETIFKGGVVLEIDNIINGTVTNIFEIPRENTILPLKKIRLDHVGVNAVDYTADEYKPWVMEIESRYGLGLLNRCAPHIIWKRNATQAWAEYSDIFGIPFRHATTTSRNQQDYDMIEKMLEQMGSAAYGVFPDGTEVSILDSKKGDSYNVFDMMINRCNSEMSKGINATTMLSDSGSSYSQAEVHEHMNQRLINSDGEFLVTIINDILLPKLQMHGILNAEQCEFEFEHKKLGKTELWEITSKLLETHDVDEDWMAETFQIPIIGKKQENSNFDKGTAKQKPTGARAEQSPIVQFPIYEQCCSHKSTITASNELRDKRVKELEKVLLKLIHEGKSTEVAETELATYFTQGMYNALVDAWGKDRLDAIELDYDAVDHNAITAMEMSIQRFTMTKTAASVLELNRLMIDENGKVKSFSKFKADAEPFLTMTNSHWLRTEYNKAIAVGQNVSSYYAMMENKEIYPYMQYQSIGDDRVRDEHKRLDGMIFNKDDKNARKLLPPNGYNCRCELVEYTGANPSKISKGTEAIQELGDAWKTMKKQGFDVNRAELKEVFDANEAYLQNWDIAERVRELDSRDYELSSVKVISKNSLDLPYQEVKDISKLFKSDYKEGDKEYMIFRDYNNRLVKLSHNVFKNHTQGKYIEEGQRRHEIFHLITEVLNNADEVYSFDFNKNQLFNYRFIKFYKGKTMVVDTNCTLKKGLEIGTWYASDNNTVDVDQKIRRGILLKK